MPTLNELKTALKAALAEDLEIGLDAIGKILSTDSRKYNDLVHHKSRFNSNNRSIFLGTIAGDDANRTKSQISQALLHLIDSLKEEDLQIAATSGKLDSNDRGLPPTNRAITEGNNNIIIQGTTDSHITINTGNTTHQTADKIYNIDKIDKADFS